VPHASPIQVWDELRSRAGESAVLLVGHEPLVSRLLSHVLDAPSLRADIGAGCLVLVREDRLRPHPSGELKWMLAPPLA
jgi:phosphohistidine phosphatase SixA